MRGILRTHFPPLPRSVTTLQVGGLVNAFGNGITLPFLLIYRHEREHHGAVDDERERSPAASSRRPSRPVPNGAVHAPLVSDLAEPRLLGRYMALSALFMAGRVRARPSRRRLRARVRPNAVWLGAAALCTLGGMLAFLVETTLPARARRTPIPSPASA